MINFGGEHIEYVIRVYDENNEVIGRMRRQSDKPNWL